ncbi:MAG TPA: glycosyltransferase [Candidatus Saccharibacteria bacterium]|nr:glycosyltransferase [Candidatus Saccharibacteria bacterium]
MNKKPIFFDISGKRRRVVNSMLTFISIIVIILTGFIGVYTLRLNKINRLASNLSTKEVSPRSHLTLLYTTTHEDSYVVTHDQIEKIDTIILPKYKVTDEEITTPEDYSVQIEDIQDISKNKPVHYQSFFLLSPFDYTLVPTERETERSLIRMDMQSLISYDQMVAIKDDLSAHSAHGLYIELPYITSLSQESADSLSSWIDEFRSVLDEDDLSLGIMTDARTLMTAYSTVGDHVQFLYVRFDDEVTRQAQIEALRTISWLPKKSTIYEVPTISTSTDAYVYNDYTESVPYQTLEPELMNKELSNRSYEPTSLITNAKKYEINDAVTVYNLVHHLKSLSLVDDVTEYSIVDPGYEEYTTWKYLQDPYEDLRNHYLLSENVRGSLDIKKEGEGEVVSLKQDGIAGTRKTIYDDSGIITMSTMTVDQIPTIVNKTGKLPKKIAITFDDGPNAQYTSQVMDILDRYGVKGTFFVIGYNVLANPDTAREIVNRGHEIENHSYNHPVFSRLVADSQQKEIQANSELINAVTGQSPSYFRKPYSDNNEVQTEDDVNFLGILRKLNMESSEYDIDSKDWLLETPDQVVQRVIDELNHAQEDYSQILFHDNHSDVFRTLEALPRVIEYLQANGIQIVRVDELVQSTYEGVAVTTTEFRALSIKNKIFVAFVWTNIFLITIAILKYSWMIIGGFIYFIKGAHRRRQSNKHAKKQSKKRPTFGVIIACYNEELVIGRTIEGLLNGTYKNFKITIVNDGSKDNTAKVVKAYCKKDKRVRLITVPNGGKARALEQGIAKTRNQWIVFCDADTIFHPDALQNFADNIASNKKVAAIAGRIFVGNTVNALTRSQAIEYGVAHIFLKAAQHIINSITVVPGALGIWERKSLMKNGGFTSDTLAEDADATMSIISMKRRVVYNSAVTAKTEAPEDLKQLYKQRTRWQLGNMQAAIKHHKGLFRPRYGALGFYGLPMMIHELITTMLFPLLLGFSVFVLMSRFYNWHFLIPYNLRFISSSWFILLSFSLIITELAISIFVILVEKTSIKNKLKLVATLPYYITFYKAFLSYSTIVAVLRAARGTLQGWGHLTRTANVK